MIAVVGCVGGEQAEAGGGCRLCLPDLLMLGSSWTMTFEGEEDGVEGGKRVCVWRVVWYGSVCVLVWIVTSVYASGVEGRRDRTVSR